VQRWPALDLPIVAGLPGQKDRCAHQGLYPTYNIVRLLHTILYYNRWSLVAGGNKPGLGHVHADKPIVISPVMFRLKSLFIVIPRTGAAWLRFTNQ
jgi:hypothetical protein